MRLATIRTAGSTSAALVVDAEAVEIGGYGDVGALLAEDQWGEIARGASGAHHPLGQIDLGPVVTKPAKVICLGLNYRAHIEETGSPVPQYPTLFAKFARALIGPFDPLILPAVSEMVDWEVELAMVIGKETRHAGLEAAAEAIAGYTVLNDVSVRDYQNRTLQWLQGKTFEKTTPAGPWMVTPDEVDHARDLLVQCEVDGEIVQKARTSDLVFKPAEIVSYISQILTLEPGDLIATGTPSGVGMARNPPVWLREGQVVRTSIEGIGELVNECVKEQR